ncbi:MAG: SGNH/GDSL hydrolase family protein [Chitinophagaceae bacterium]
MHKFSRKSFVTLCCFFLLMSCKKSKPIDTSLNNLCGDSVYFAGDSFFYDKPWFEGIPTAYQKRMAVKVFRQGMPGAGSTAIADSFEKRRSYFSAPVFVWAGQNNNWSSETVKEDILRITKGHSKFYVFELTSGNLPDRWIGTEYRRHNDQLNNEIEEMVGKEHFIRVIEPMGKLAITAQDSIDVQHGSIPSSYLSDWLHPNEKGNEAIVNSLLQHLKPCR